MQRQIIFQRCMESKSIRIFNSTLYFLNRKLIEITHIMEIIKLVQKPSTIYNLAPNHVFTNNDLELFMNYH
jgi:hypothetical protein